MVDGGHLGSMPSDDLIASEFALADADGSGSFNKDEIHAAFGLWSLMFTIA